MPVATLVAKAAGESENLSHTKLSARFILSKYSVVDSDTFGGSCAVFSDFDLPPCDPLEVLTCEIG
jgi:hypothetical protein